MVAPGGALNTERTWQAPSVDEGAAQQKLDLCIVAAQLVLCPTNNCAIDRWIKSDKDASSLRSTLHQRPHWQRDPTFTTGWIRPLDGRRKATTSLDLRLRYRDRKKR
jgi:hypothetical protein